MSTGNDPRNPGNPSDPAWRPPGVPESAPAPIPPPQSAPPSGDMGSDVEGLPSRAEAMSRMAAGQRAPARTQAPASQWTDAPGVAQPETQSLALRMASELRAPFAQMVEGMKNDPRLGQQMAAAGFGEPAMAPTGQPHPDPAVQAERHARALGPFWSKLISELPQIMQLVVNWLQANGKLNVEPGPAPTPAPPLPTPPAPAPGPVPPPIPPPAAPGGEPYPA